MKTKLVNLGNSFAKLKAIMDYTPCEKHGCAYKIKADNADGCYLLLGVPMLQDGSLAIDSEFEVDLVNAFDLESLKTFRADMLELFPDKTGVVNYIFDNAVETYKLYLTINMD
jgi:hypothetical protein